MGRATEPILGGPSFDIGRAVATVAARLRHFYIDGLGDLLSSLAIALGVVVAVLLVELCFTEWKRSSASRLSRLSPSARTDLLAFLLVESSLALLVGMAMFFGVTYVLQKLIAAGFTHVARLTLSSAIPASLIYFLVIDLVHYGAHRLYHAVPTLWELHRYHHSAPEMTVLTAFRDHPMERAVTALLLAVPAALVAMPVQNFIVLHLLAKMIGLLKHSNLRSNWGWFGRYVIQSPGAHWIHHSVDPAHHNRNFASLFQFWDIIFGTAVHPQPETLRTIRIGLVDNTGHPPPLRYLGSVFCASWSRLLRNRHAS